jgi:tetratricopeptide (TPR) repeat protein
MGENFIRSENLRTVYISNSVQAAYAWPEGVNVYKNDVMVRKAAEEKVATDEQLRQVLDAHYERGYAYVSTRNYEEAIKEFKEGLKFAPNVEVAVHMWKLIEETKKAACAKEEQEKLEQMVRKYE